MAWYNIGVNNCKIMKLTDEVKRRFDYKYKNGETPWVRSIIDDDIKSFLKVAKREFNGGKILDLGCGNGWLSIYFARNGFKVKGVDSSPVAIKEAKNIANKAKVSVEFKTGDALDFQYPNKEFDIVVDRGLLHHIPKSSWIKYVKGIVKVLKIDGLFYLMVFSDKSKKSGFDPKSGRMWRKVKEGSYLTYDHFFNKKLISDIFDKNFKIISFNQDLKAQPNGSKLLYFTLRKKA